MLKMAKVMTKVMMMVMIVTMKKHQNHRPLLTITVGVIASQERLLRLDYR
jgi:hypothetical protein